MFMFSQVSCFQICALERYVVHTSTPNRSGIPSCIISLKRPHFISWILNFRKSRNNFHMVCVQHKQKHQTPTLWWQTSHRVMFQVCEFNDCHAPNGAPACSHTWRPLCSHQNREDRVEEHLFWAHGPERVLLAHMHAYISRKFGRALLVEFILNPLAYLWSVTKKLDVDEKNELEK